VIKKFHKTAKEKPLGYRWPADILGVKLSQDIVAHWERAQFSVIPGRLTRTGWVDLVAHAQERVGSLVPHAREGETLVFCSDQV
jgi:hypothetical protein